MLRRALLLATLGLALVLLPSAATADGRCGPNPCMADVGIFGHAEPQPVPLGSESSYKFTAQNNGPDGTTGIEIQVTVPDGLRILSATPYGGDSCTVAGTFVDCQMGAFAAEQLGVVVIKVKTVKVGTWIAPAKVYSSGVIDDNGGNNQVSATLGVTPAVQHSSARAHRRRRRRRHR